ncbi:MAG: hypothetical protein QMD71_06295 [bacterium]|nr:hypothetical protein [bacterium]
MMPHQIRLDQAINQILDAIVQTIEAEITEGGLLEGVKTVVRGDKTRPKPETPSVFIFTDMAQMQQSPRTLAEQWRLPVIFATTVKNDDPEEGYRQVTELAAKVRSAVLRNRTLGLRNFVQDTKSLRFEAGGPNHQQGSLFGAAAVVEVLFTILEPSQ